MGVVLRCRWRIVYCPSLGTTGLYESKNGGTIELVLRTVGYMVLQKFVFILRLMCPLPTSMFVTSACRCGGHYDSVPLALVIDPKAHPQQLWFIKSSGTYVSTPLFSLCDLWDDCRNIFEFDFLFPKEHTETKHCRTQIFRSRLTKFGQKSFDWMVKSWSLPTRIGLRVQPFVFCHLC